MENENTLCCDTCLTVNTDMPIVEKPTRFGYKGSIIQLETENNGGRLVDNICLDCLEEEISRAKTDWF